MPKYLIEREIPQAGQMSPEELRMAAQKSCEVLRSMGPRVNWQQSYVTGDKIYCVYIADSEQDVREHATRSGFPATRISQVSSVIDGATAD